MIIIYLMNINLIFLCKSVYFIYLFILLNSFKMLSLDFVYFLWLEDMFLAVRECWDRLCV